MLNGGHYDLNSVQYCSDSSKERSKMILNQELAFMGQVFDLHRLYRIQTAMADDIKQRGLADYDSHAGDVNSSPSKVNNQIKYAVNDKQCSAPGLKPNPLDLQLSADEFIRQSANPTFRGSPTEAKNKNTFAFDLNLPVNIDEETSEKGSEHRSWIGKRTCASPPDIIDLEDPNTCFPKIDLDFGLPPGFSAPNSSLRDGHVFQNSIISDKPNLQSVLKNGRSQVSDGTTSSRPSINVDQTYPRQTLDESGFNGDIKPSATSISCKPILLDLNTIQLDDLSDLSYTCSGVVNPLASAFSNVIQSTFVSSVSPMSMGVSHVNNRAETLNLHVQHNFKDKISADAKPEDNKGKIIFIDLVSDSDSDSSEELCCSKSSDPKVESVGSSSKLLKGHSCEIEMGKGVGTEVGTEKDPESFCQILSVTEQPSDQNLLNSFQSEGVINVQTWGIETIRSHVNGGNSDLPSSYDESQMIDIGLCDKNKGKAVYETAEKVGESLGESSIQKLNLVTEQPSDQKLSNSSQSESVINVQTCGIETIRSYVNGGNSDLPSSYDESLCVKNKGKEVYETAEKVGESLGELSFQKMNLVTEQPSDQKLSNSSQSESVINIHTCGIKTVTQFNVNGGDSNFPSSHDESQMIDMGLCAKNKGKELDETAEKADEVELSLQKLNSEACQRKEHDRPQCSSDSYEALVLNAKECGPDDYCVSSNAFDVDVSESKESRYKLKRGTRMRNFQKDILSSLSTLSRQEIREDVNTFDGVIRSREYKKMRGKMADDDDWYKPTRSKRSRISRR